MEEKFFIVPFGVFKVFFFEIVNWIEFLLPSSPTMFYKGFMKVHESDGGRDYSFEEFSGTSEFLLKSFLNFWKTPLSSRKFLKTP